MKSSRTSSSQEKLPLRTTTGIPQNNLFQKKFSYYIVLDLEGTPDNTELPCMLLDGKDFHDISRFNVWIQPPIVTQSLSSNPMNPFMVNLESNATPFPQALIQLHDWLYENKLVPYPAAKEYDFSTTKSISQPQPLIGNFCFITCGNWDIGKSIPLQCEKWNLPLPSYFHYWINIKDVYLNFYQDKRNSKGMAPILKALKIPLEGQHHLGMHDVENIAKIVRYIVKDGGKEELYVTGMRSNTSSTIQYRYQTRVKPSQR